MIKRITNNPVKGKGILWIQCRMAADVLAAEKHKGESELIENK
jgi:hypothetical protein